MVVEHGVFTTNGDFIETNSIIISSGYQYDFSFLNGKVHLSECQKKGTGHIMIDKTTVCFQVLVMF